MEYCNQPVCLCVCLSVCLSASISLEPLDRSAQNFLCRSPVAVARSSSGGIALRYVLPVLWITSQLAVMGMRPSRVGSTQHRRSVTCVSGLQSNVYECLFQFASKRFCNSADIIENFRARTKNDINLHCQDFRSEPWCKTGIEVQEEPSDQCWSCYTNVHSIYFMMLCQVQHKLTWLVNDHKLCVVVNFENCKMDSQ